VTAGNPSQHPLAETPREGGDQSLEGADSRMGTLMTQVKGLVRAIKEGDDELVESTVLELSGRRRIFAPLVMVIGALSMLFEGLKLLFSNWRLTLIQILPATWIWLAMVDLKIHVFHDKSFHPLDGWALITAIAVVVVITAASTFLNAVFAFAISRPGKPEIRPAFTRARAHASTVLGTGSVIGLMLGLAALYTVRFEGLWFSVSMSIVIGIMMVAYVAVPSRLIGMRTTYSKSDKLKASVVGGALGAVVCSPPYILGRVGILMLGWPYCFIPGVIFLTVGVTLQIGATSSVKAITMSAKLVAGRKP